ncbi:hypothetical protein [Streptomyces sp. NPDC056543]|uniref:hypothetical protein n=1 Tax=unclassified Streptomyces TaxID=2593676 RepID=UPI0036A44376
MTPEQRTVGDIAVAALAQDHEELCRLINDVHRRQVRDATASAMTLIVASLRNCFTEADWQAVVDGARLVLLELEMETP